MKRLNRGFTLVELLVVMAIISILAAIAVPNAIKYIAKGKAVKALGDINSIKGSLVAILSDSGRGNLMQLFNADRVGQAIGAQNGIASVDGFKTATAIYTNALYGILREGRGIAVSDEVIPGTSTTYREVLNQGVCKKLGSSYLPIGFDPWGNLYNIYPGPWPSINGPIPFRKRLAESESSQNGAVLPGKGDKEDALTVAIPDPDDPNSTMKVSYPASRDLIAFIWSNGANLISGQAIYNPAGYATPDPLDNYDVAANQEPSLVGGGDDINNWDAGASWSSFY